MTRNVWMLILTVALVAMPAMAQDETTPAPADPGTAIGSDDPTVVPAGDMPAGDAPAGDGAEGAPADAPGGDEKPAEGEGQPKKGMDWTFPAIIIGVLVMMFFFSSRSKRKQESKRREMLSAISKGDKVTSIGGICGTVVDTREDEIVVKVDESTRMRFARWAIRGVGDEGKSENPEGEKK